MGDRPAPSGTLPAAALLVLLLATGVPGAAAHDGHQVQTVPYDTSLPGPVAHASVDNPTPMNNWRDFQLGGNTLPLDDGRTQAQVHLLDITQRDVPGRIALYGVDGDLLYLEDFCFETTVDLPPEAAEITVMASPLIDPCPVQGLNHGPAVQGEILLVFH